MYLKILKDNEHLLSVLQVWKMVGGAWGVAAFASVPMLYVFKLGYRGGKTLCVSIFSEVPLSHRKAFLTYAAIMVFVIPFIVLMFCYLRIFLKIARKAREARVSQRHSVKPGKVHLQSTPSSSLPKAKIKTLKMTLVIMALFVMCAMPYFIAEMIMSYGDHTIISNSMYGLLGGLAAANSAANPYVFLLFNVQCKGKTDLKRLGSDGTGTVRVYSTNSTRSDFHHESKVFKPHYYKWQNSQNSEVEMQSMIR